MLALISIMKNTLLILSMIFISIGCKTENKKIELDFLTEKIPQQTPIEFKEPLIPDNKIIHKGIFSPDLNEFYYTISDQNFQNFDVFRIEKNNGTWTDTEHAFFNSEHDEHGMSFSPDGNTIFFSSTRPVNIDGIASTWHIWKCDKVDGVWREPIFVDIPNLRNKLVSHPTITNSGTLYFHSSNLDYTQMSIYKSKELNNHYSDAQKISMNLENDSCTPFISPNEDYLIFASIGNQLDLMISYNNGDGHWSNPKKFNDKINYAGQGNPYVTPDNKFLFYTSSNDDKMDWSVKWVNIESEINNNYSQQILK